ncbi:Ig-like domain repeat protein [Cellulomonas sp. McL0617]|uniref:Ig-like domain-containing protein n=1 Tax=Cellulomonas sp. McL0617 TaxID=3415675 RepID=UPI003CE90241
MSSARNVRRRIAAGTTALALVSLGLVGLASGANAVDSVPPTPKFGGTFYLADGNTFADLTQGSSAIQWGQGTSAFPAAGDSTNPVGSVPAGAQLVYQFISPQGQEANISAWNAYTSTPLITGGQYLENTFPLGIAQPGAGSPSGQAAVAAAGGDYSLGWAYTDSGKLNVVNGGLFYVHIHVTAGTTSTATYTYQTVQQTVVTTPTTTTITAAPTTVASGTPFNLTATVAPVGATGTVQFKNGATPLGSPVTVTGGTATLTGTTLANATASPINASITAVYSGDTSFATSTSAASTISVTPGPIVTTTTVTATSASGNENRPVALTANVSPVAAAGAGSVVFTGSLDGAPATTIAGPIPVNASGVASANISTLGAGAWVINAAFTGVAPYVSSASTTAANLSLTAVTVPTDQREDPQDVTVTIPAGTLTITTPWTSADPLDLGTAILDDATSTYYTDPAVFGSATDQAQAIQVIDRRSGAPGFTAQVKSTPFTSGANAFDASHLGLVNLAKHQVTSNTLQAGDVTLTNIPANTPGLSGSSQTFATYGAGHATGTAWISGDVELKGIPSSVQPGLYRATLTFTVM